MSWVYSDLTTYSLLETYGALKGGGEVTATAGVMSRHIRPVASMTPGPVGTAAMTASRAGAGYDGDLDYDAPWHYNGGLPAASMTGAP